MVIIRKTVQFNHLALQKESDFNQMTQSQGKILGIVFTQRPNQKVNHVIKKIQNLSFSDIPESMET